MEADGHSRPAGDEAVDVDERLMRRLLGEGGEGREKARKWWCWNRRDQGRQTGRGAH